MTSRALTPRSRAAVTAAIAAAVLTATSLVPVGPAEAVDGGVPSAGVLRLEGRGFGHGRGMSQWGARGAAVQGLTWQQVLAHYYPGTALAQHGDPEIRVLISADADGDLAVQPQAGLAVTSGGQSLTLPTGASYDRWRVRRTATGPVLERLDGATWSAHATAFPLLAVTELTAPSRLLRLVLPDGRQQELRGRLRAAADGTVQRTVAVLGTESYLRGVVPAEMPASWPQEALRSQSVAARSYATRLKEERPGTAVYDTCDTTSCQVFAGTATYAADGTLLSRGENAATDQAIAATAGAVLRHTAGGVTKTAFTEFSAANGGWTAAGSPAHPYLVAKADPYDGVVPSTAHSWTAEVTAASVQSRLPSIGTLRRVVVDQRTGQGELGGRILRATVVGSAGSVDLSGSQLRTALGVRSDWFAFLGTGFSRDWNGDDKGDVLALTAAGDLLLYPGNGAGGFGTRRQVGSRWDGLALVTQTGDWDGDGHGDVVARSRADGSLVLLRGNGSGGFLGSGAIGSGWQVFDLLVAPGDWDGDGAPDLVARRSDDATLWLYPGDGAGGFLRPAQVGTGWAGMGVVTAVGDWDENGTADLVARRTTDGALLLYPGSGTGGFGRVRQIGSGWGSMDAVRGPGDWTGDGHVDLLARHVSGALYLYPGTGSGGFGRSRQIGSGWGPLTLVG